MKHRIFAVFIFVVAIFGAYAVYGAFKPSGASGKTNEDGHELKSLWRDYRNAYEKDLPESMLRILQQIKNKALERGLAWDYYDASCRYVDVATTKNWKIRDSLEAAFLSDIEKSGFPLAVFSARLRAGEKSSDLYAYIQSETETLTHRYTPAFYRDLSMWDQSLAYVPFYLKNDYEYALWKLYSTARGTDFEREMTLTLKKFEGQSYLSSTLEYIGIKDIDNDAERCRAMESFAVKHEGQAVSMLAEGDLLQEKFSHLKSDSSSTSTDYVNLLGQCQAYSKKAASFRKKEAAIVSCLSTGDEIADILQSKSLSHYIADGNAAVVLRNLTAAKLQIISEEGRHIVDTLIRSTKERFYLSDTISVRLPSNMDDGLYLVKSSSGQYSSQSHIGIYSLSIATRAEQRGVCIYAANSESGEPCAKTDLSLFCNGKKIAEYEDFEYDGFTPLPDGLCKAMQDDTFYYIECSLESSDRILRSRRACLSSWSQASVPTDSGEKDGMIFTDRGAYRPGDTLHYAALALESTDNEGKKPLQGIALQVGLFDPEGQKVDSTTVFTGEFGTADGLFVLPDDSKNGIFTLTTHLAGRLLCQETVRVEDYVLPTYEIILDDGRQSFLYGEKAIVSGKIVSYTGHGLDGSRVTYSISAYDGRKIKSGDAELSDSGTFSISFDPEQESSSDEDIRHVGYYNTVFRVAGLSGETKEVSRYLSFSRNLRLEARIEGESSGTSNRIDKADTPYGSSAVPVFYGDTVRLHLDLYGGYSGRIASKAVYAIEDEKGVVVAKGQTDTGEDTSIQVKRTGYYLCRAIASVQVSSGKEYRDTACVPVLLLSENDTVLDAPVRDLFAVRKTEIASGEDIVLTVGEADGSPLWAVADIFDKERRLIDTRLIRLSGARAEAGSLEYIAFPYKDSYPDELMLQVFYFRRHSSGSFFKKINRRKDKPQELPVSVTRFKDTAFPGSRYSIEVKTSPDAECLVSVYDKAADAVSPLSWRQVSQHLTSSVAIWVESVCGNAGGDGCLDSIVGSEMSVMDGVAYEKSSMSRYPGTRFYAKAKAPARSYENKNLMDDMSAGSGETEVRTRQNFATTLAFKPHIRSGKDGRFSFDFHTSDNLSTYVIAMYVHDRKMNDKIERKEFKVTLPVKISLSKTEYLYDVDSLKVRTVLSSMAESDVCGIVRLAVFSGADSFKKGSQPVLYREYEVSVPAGKSVYSEISFNAGHVACAGDSLGVYAGFFPLDNSASGGIEISPSANSPSGDAMFVAIPVLPSSTVIRESHSALLMGQADKDSLVSVLRSRFVNIPSDSLLYKEITIRELLSEVLVEKASRQSQDVIGQVDAIYASMVAGRYGVMMDSLAIKKMTKMITACRNADGGYSWFPGMESSPAISASILEKFGRPGIREFLDSPLLSDIVSTLPETVAYLDSVRFTVSPPYGVCFVPDPQYVYIRSMYADVPFRPYGLDPDKGFDSKAFALFKKRMRSYMLGQRAGGADGQILSKALRVTVLRNFLSSGSGEKLASEFGIGGNRRMSKVMCNDLLSLMDYAVPHKSGGCYYPGAVARGCGLLEGSVFAHSLICDILSESSAVTGQKEKAKAIADGIRIWLILQKDGQQWPSTPEFADAVSSVMQGEESLLSSKIAIMSGERLLPFADIRSSGNGFSVTRAIYSDGKLLRQGDSINVGDKIKAVYKLNASDSRSFVVLSAPREAALRPVLERSGVSGGLLRKVSMPYLQPSGYRDVRQDRTVYYFYTLPEGESTIEEEFFATASGVFSAPPVEVSSAYAMHYRAVCGSSGSIAIR